MDEHESKRMTVREVKGHLARLKAQSAELDAIARDFDEHRYHTIASQVWHAMKFVNSATKTIQTRIDSISRFYETKSREKGG